MDNDASQETRTRILAELRCEHKAFLSARSYRAREAARRRFVELLKTFHEVCGETRPAARSAGAGE